MQISAYTLKQAWHQAIAGSDVLDDAMLPPIGTSPGQYEQRVGKPHGPLFLVLDDDGTARGHIGPYREVFATQDLDRVLYFAAEDAVRKLAEHIAARSPGLGPVANLVDGQAKLLDRIDPVWGSRFRNGGMDGTQPSRPCGRDPLERLAWIAGSWREQDPYTHLAFFRGENIDAEQIALLHGADPAQIAAGTRAVDLPGMDGGAFGDWDIVWETCCFGQAGTWAFLMYHEIPGSGPGLEALARLGVTETVHLSATSAKAIYTFDYMRDGCHIDDDWGTLELIGYDRGRTPYFRGGQLDFLNQAIRRAELDHPELTGEFELYFHALDDAFDLQLPRQDIQEGTVRAAQWARRNS
ncbi:hypothetical protein [Streptomyces violascens]|uniref:hypothetical protein n=1 Tax=Streptomyces violascens TaxID=67381 RepID=UPI001677C02E|nr:hypothetical protein [Streptomyces violascens]GGU48691.1 hypothetical protein GCM10010289_81490 [Streptomyces violascens]